MHFAFNTKLTQQNKMITVFRYTNPETPDKEPARESGVLAEFARLANKPTPEEKLMMSIGHAFTQIPPSTLVGFCVGFGVGALVVANASEKQTCGNCNSIYRSSK